MGGRLVITQVQPGSPGEKAGLAVGDVISSVGGKRVGSLAEYYETLWRDRQAGAMVELRVLVGWSIVIGLLSLPFLYSFWRSWDRPSRAALEEQDRRIEERDTRDAFIREDTKLREQEHLMALAAPR